MAVHLSSDLQNELEILGSNVRLARTIYGDFPDNYAFMRGKGKERSFDFSVLDEGRLFRAEFASSQAEYSIQLFERTPEFDYENFFGRAVINDIRKLALLIDLWVDKRADIVKLSQEFSELELFKPFEFRNENEDIEKAWVKVKNLAFGSSDFWERREWYERYEIMLNAAKRHKSFMNYYPLTTHYNLRFSLDFQKTTTWDFWYSIVPVHDKSKGSFHFEVGLGEDESVYFDDINNALDFYADLLARLKPTKWR